MAVSINQVDGAFRFRLIAFVNVLSFSSCLFPLSVWQVTPLTFGGKINTYNFNVQVFLVF